MLPCHRLALAFALLAEAFSERVTITSGSDLVRTLSSDSGTSYAGKTIVLTNDIELTPQESAYFSPIGAGKAGPSFEGTFDGRGHIISGLNVTVPKLYVGLFGRSSGATIRNVVLSETCAFGSTFTSSLKSTSDLHIGSFAGLCDDCLIERCVSMADVTFTGWLSHLSVGGGRAFIGGIAGTLSGASTVRACGMYGSIRHAGSSRNTDIGGLVGAVLPAASAVLECSGFYGAVSHSSFTRWDLNCGCIIGTESGRNCSIVRCVSAGRIRPETSPDNTHIGTIMGAYNSSSGIVRVSESVWDKEQSVPQVGLNEEAVDALDAYSFALVTRMDCISVLKVLGDSWVLAQYRGRIGRFGNEGWSSVKMLAPRAALPVPARGRGKNAGAAFGGWYFDKELSRKYSEGRVEQEREGDGVVVLYPKWVRSWVSGGTLVLLGVVVLGGVAFYWYRKNKKGGSHHRHSSNYHFLSTKTSE